MLDASAAAPMYGYNEKSKPREHTSTKHNTFECGEINHGILDLLVRKRVLAQSLKLTLGLIRA
jgi:hypothetical protein